MDRCGVGLGSLVVVDRWPLWRMPISGGLTVSITLHLGEKKG